MSLCRRCERRARAYETNLGARFQCTDLTSSVSSCYMYQPTKPAMLKREKGDKRSQFGAWQLTARSQFNGVCEDLKMQIIDYKRKGKALIWVKL